MLLRNLRDLGYLEYDHRSRSFTPSIRVALLGSWIGNRFSEAAALGERLSALQRKTSETALVAIQNVAAAQYVLVQPAQHPDRLEVDSGQFRSLTCSATGRVLLSLKCDEEIVGWVKRCNAEAVEQRFKVRLQEFMALMSRVRDQGYAETAGDITPGAGAFAVAIPSPMGRMPVAVAVGGPLSRIAGRKAEIVRALREIKESFARDSLLRHEETPAFGHLPSFA
jgi:DNA-binding IclR family transcriptional regulator